MNEHANVNRAMLAAFSAAMGEMGWTMHRSGLGADRPDGLRTIEVQGSVANKWVAALTDGTDDGVLLRTKAMDPPGRALMALVMMPEFVAFATAGRALTPADAWPELQWEDDQGAWWTAAITTGHTAIRVTVWKRDGQWSAEMAGHLPTIRTHAATVAEALEPVRAELRAIIAALTETSP